MPCPYFRPTDVVSLACLPHPQRLPIGNAYAGHCTAANVTPNDAMLHDCNLGYATCEHLPADRDSDAVRFSVRRDPNGLIAISYVFERSHAPVSHGILIYDPGVAAWREVHADERVQRMAECCIESLSKDR